MKVFSSPNTVKSSAACIILPAFLLLLSCGGGAVKTGLITQDIKLPAGARLDSVYPVNVLPGTLFCVIGEGLGNIPAVVKVGSIEIREILVWDGSTIFFRIPDGVKNGDRVQVGGLTADTPLILASKGSIKVVWKVDADGVNQRIKQTAEAHNVSPKTVLKPPLFIKGQWSKKSDNFGFFDAGWDGGMKAPMYNIPGTSLWISECVYTPDNVASFNNNPMLFAFEDMEVEEKNISGFESDAAAVLKLEWAADDEYTSISTDPGVLVSKDNKNYNPDSGAINICFPMVK